jgi:two-component system, OmpR family, phosphate regulon sensor histidine kinase PhoR
VSSDNSFIMDRNIDVHIRAIQKKLEKHRYLIETIYGVGYRFKDAEA